MEIHLALIVLMIIIAEVMMIATEIHRLQITVPVTIHFQTVTNKLLSTQSVFPIAWEFFGSNANERNQYSNRGPVEEPPKVFVLR